MIDIVQLDHLRHNIEKNSSTLEEEEILISERFGKDAPTVVKPRVFLKPCIVTLNRLFKPIHPPKVVMRTKKYIFGQIQLL